MKKLFLLILLIIFISDVVSAYDCIPPMSFAKEHNCILYKSSENSINRFICDPFFIVGDCEGEVISYDKMSTFTLESNTFKSGLVIFSILLVIVGLFIAFKKLNEDDEDEFTQDRGENYY